MKQPRIFALFSVLSVALAAPTSASPLFVDLRLASIPSSITLCRDGAVMAMFPVDHQWQIGFNLDDNGTGDQTGRDALLVVQTLEQSTPCAPVVEASGSAFVSGVFRWNTSSADWEFADFTTIVVDAPNATLRMSVDDSVLSPSGVGSIAGIDSVAFSGWSTGGEVAFAFDEVPVFTRGTSPSVTVNDPAADVGSCGQPSCANATWFPLVDIRSLRVSRVTDQLFAAGFE